MIATKHYVLRIGGDVPTAGEFIKRNPDPWIRFRSTRLRDLATRYSRTVAYDERRRILADGTSGLTIKVEPLFIDGWMVGEWPSGFYWYSIEENPNLRHGLYAIERDAIADAKLHVAQRRKLIADALVSP